MITFNIRLMKYKNFILSAISLLLITSCQKGNVVIDKSPIDPGAYARFNTLTLADSITTYYIKSTNDPYKLPIGVTNVASKDRTVKFTYTSNNAVAGTQYNSPATLIIPAGKAVDTLRFAGLFSGYPQSSRKDTVLIQIVNSDDIWANPYITPRKDMYRLILRKYCDVDLLALAGNYTRCIDNGSYGPYPMTVTTPLSGGATSGSVVVTNLWDLGAPTSTTVNLDWSNPASFTATIPDQVFYGPADLWIKGTTAGTFSSCDQTFTLKYTLYFKTSGANYYANQVTTVAR